MRNVGQRAAVTAGYVIAFGLLDRISSWHDILAWSPQAGLTLAFVMRFGPQQGVWVLVASWLSAIWVRGASPTDLQTLGAASVFAASYSLLAWALRKFKVGNLIETPTQVTALICLGGTILWLGAVLHAMVTTASLTQLGDSVARFWAGNFNWILAFTPLLLAMDQWRRALRVIGERPVEVILQALSLLLALWVDVWLRSQLNVAFLYPIFVPVMWISFRWGVSGSAISLLAVQCSLFLNADNYGDASLLTNLQFLAIARGATGLLLGSIVSSRAGALRQVARREAEQRTLLATAPEAILSTDAGGNIVSANAAASGLFVATAEVVVGSPISRFMPELRLIGDTGRIDTLARCSSGKMIPIDVAWARLDVPASGFILVIRDSSARVIHEAQLRERDAALARATRMAVVGEFASALTHELNQPMTALVSYLRSAEILASQAGRADPRLNETLSKAASEALRASDVLRRLRDFYRGDVVQLSSIDIDKTLRQALAAHDERCKQLRVEIGVVVDEPLPPISGDQTQIEIVMHNLINNALDALSTAQGERRLLLHLSRHNDEVWVDVEDSGPGIPAEVADILFDPFVTTKSEGMGLGLAISRTLLRNHGGDLWCDAEYTAGAHFVARIPLHPNTKATI